MNNGYRVNCGTEVENWTRFPLTSPHVEVSGGAIDIPPRAILPSKREAMASGCGSCVLSGWLSERLVNH